MACSTCLLEQGHVPNCEFKTAGGNERKAYIISSCQITALDDYASGIINDITLEAGGAWYELVCRKDTITGNAQYEPTNEILNQQVVFTVSQRGAGATREDAAQEAVDFVDALTASAENFHVLLQERDGVWKLYGGGVGQGLEREDIQATTGAATSDQAGTTITLTGPGRGMAKVVDSAVAAAIAAA